jgi:predicted alpha/beta superfamily hydrolase
MTPTSPTETPTRPKKKMWRRMGSGMRNLLGRMMGSPVSAPELRLHRKFRSRFLEPLRTLVVFVPPGYERNLQKRYPVLYMHDGQNLFDPTTAFGGNEWRLDDTAEELIEHGAIEPLIIVGIYNTGEQRIHEYTPTADPKLGGGKADLYGRMLVEEVKPFIEKTYRAVQGAENTGLGGSSLGGLVTLHLGLKYPDVFGKLAVLSPSVWWDNKVILREIEQLPAKPPLKIWLDMGTAEGGMSLEDTEMLRDAMRAKGWSVGNDLAYSEIEGATHSEKSWAERVGPFLQFLFPAGPR